MSSFPSKFFPINWNRKTILILKRLGVGAGGARGWDEGGGMRGSIWPPPLHRGFSKNVSSKERLKSWFLVTFNIILRHIFPEKFIEFPQLVQKLWTISLSILAIFFNVHRSFGFFDIILLQRNYWCQLIKDDVGILLLSTYDK